MPPSSLSSLAQEPATAGQMAGPSPPDAHRASKSPVNAKKLNIIDIRRECTEFDLPADIHRGLRPENGGEKSLPTLLLYDEKGLKLFEDITYLDEYYPTNTEIEILQTHADDIARNIRPGSMLVELGSGNLRKVNILLQALDRLGKPVEYYALDVSLPELHRTLLDVPAGGLRHVTYCGLHGTYDDALVWLQHPQVAARPKAVLSLGSSIGNFTRRDAASFLRAFAQVLQRDDKLFVAVDGCKDPSRVFHAYNDRHGVTHRFILNGLAHANALLGRPEFDLGAWHVVGEYDAAAGRHHAFLAPSHDVTVDGVAVRAAERIRIEESYKYSARQCHQLWNAAQLAETRRWSNGARNYALYMMAKAPFAFPAAPHSYAATPVPGWAEWARLWALWDAITRVMLPDEELLQKPIKLRNACIFYLGHIPAFLDIKLTAVLRGAATEPAYFHRIFERGIDPDVDNPDHCHNHSEIPPEWPPLPDILAFQGRVRARVQRLYDTGDAADPEVGRCLWLGYEHEAMHMETLLYMLIQSDKCLPPPALPIPDFGALAENARASAVPNEWCAVPAQDLVLGLDDPERAPRPPRYFGWDVEKPERRVHVKAFSAKARPITNGEYLRFLRATGRDKLPASWCAKAAVNGSANGDSNGVPNGNAHGSAAATNGNTSDEEEEEEEEEAAAAALVAAFSQDKCVRTVFGPVPLSQTLDWPVAASYDELAACAAWLGGRIPTMEEARSIYHYVDLRLKADAHHTLGRTIPAVNGHLVNDGVEESPPSTPELAVNGHLVNDGVEESPPSAPDPAAAFADLRGCNVGFQHWHPVPVTQNGGRLSGLADMGGLWEWTSSPLAPHPGYEPMELYPVYSADFFDAKHNVVLGGSWATAPRIAGRKSFVNWYQRNYPYVWAGARVVRDNDA